MLIVKAVTAGSSNGRYGPRGQLGLGDTDNRGYRGDKTQSYVQDDDGDWSKVNDTNEMGDFLPAVSLGTDLSLGSNLTATAIAARYSFTCALLSNAQIKCWGGCQAPPDCTMTYECLRSQPPRAR